MERHRIILNIPHSSITGIFDNKIGGWNPEPEFINGCVNVWTDWWTDSLFYSNNPLVKTFVFPYSRFVCDVERLENDPMEIKGQGIIYTRFNEFQRNQLSVGTINKLLDLRSVYLKSISNALNESSVLIDCHSFPGYLSETEICIGFNANESCDEHIIEIVKNVCIKHGYKVSLNTPFSNSITPETNFSYPSLMIEVNKKVYMNENAITLKPEGFKRLRGCINEIYNDIEKNFNKN